jgi:hypothetical protein
MGFWRWLIQTFLNTSFCKDIEKPPEYITPQLTKDIHVDDLACSDGTPVPLKFWPNALLVAEALQVVLEEPGDFSKIKVLDAYRTIDYNRVVGGRRGSDHTQALAVDFTVQGMSTEALADLLARKINDGVIRKGEVGICEGFVHYSIGPKLVRW